MIGGVCNGAVSSNIVFPSLRRLLLFRTGSSSEEDDEEDEDEEEEDVSEEESSVEYSSESSLLLLLLLSRILIRKCLLFRDITHNSTNFFLHVFTITCRLTK